jgi:hypothetical protein
MMIGEGEYKATVISAETHEAKTGTGQIAVRVAIDTSGGLADPEEMTGYITITGAGGGEPSEKGARMARAQLKSIGFNVDGDALTDANLALLEGNLTRVTVENDTYNGKTRPKIKYFNSASGAKMSGDVLAKAQAAMRAVKSDDELPEHPPAMPPQKTPQGPPVDNYDPFPNTVDPLADPEPTGMPTGSDIPFIFIFFLTATSILCSMMA